MRVVTELPRDVREVENVWIPMSDGCRLAARLWIPAGAERSPVPAVLEYIPYRKRDGTRLRDEPMHRWFAGHGYAAVRIDLRGSGDSDGLLLDEYAPQELEDALEALRWIAARPWCDGRVGMMGKSWGGFNALQVAALAPPELRAVVTVCSTDDRYADDVHYMGGVLLNENLVWGATLLTLQAQPPDPAVAGDAWRARWRERLEALPLFPELWMRHPRRDDYWRHGSVCVDYAAIRAPVYAIGGWADAYSNAVPRLVAHLAAPCQGLVGPWAHLYPHEGVPGPAIGFLQEARRWWDRWLRGERNGVDEEPRYRAYLQEPAPPEPPPLARAGRWVAEEAWPSPRVRPWTLALAPGALLVGGRAPRATIEVRTPLSVGATLGSWCPFGEAAQLPRDQAEDDARSVSFDSPPLDERVEILGAPVATLVLAADRPAAHVVVRLCDVHPGGASERVSFALLDLAHLPGHEERRALVPGEPLRARVRLNDAAHAFERGHRVRLALSTGSWPLAWPTPELVTLRLDTQGSTLELPVRPPDPADERLRRFDPPEAAPASPAVGLHSGVALRREERGPRGERVLVLETDLLPDGEPALTRLEAIDLEHGHGVLERFSIRDDDPLSAEALVRQVLVARRGAWRTRVETEVRMTSTREAFRLEARLRALEGAATFLERTWRSEVPRDVRGRGGAARRRRRGRG